MGENKILTVVVPVYNGADRLSETLDSILESSYRNLDVLLINDGSTDKSSDICRSYTVKDLRVRYIYQENKGIVAARNRGISEAIGTYICFCDQDDIVAPDMYTKLIHKMEDYNAQIGICSTGRLIEGEKSIYEKLEDGQLCGDNINAKLLYPILFRGYKYDFVDNSNYMYGTVWKCIFSRDFIAKNNITFRRFINYEDDWIFVTEALSKADRVITDSYIGYYWKLNGTSESHKGRFIGNLTQKLKDFDDYTLSYLSGAIVDKKILGEYIKISLGEHYIDMYKNYANIPGKNEQKAYLSELEAYLNDTDYRNVITCKKYLRKSAFRKYMVYTALKLTGIKTAAKVSRLVDFAEENSSKLSLIVKIERRIKVRRRKGDSR